MKNKIKTVLISMGVEFTDDVVDALVARLDRYENIESRVSLAHVIARNWAIDQKRHVECAIARAKQDQIDQAVAELKRIRFEKAVVEFDRLVPTLKSRRICMQNALRYMRLTCIEGKSDPECEPFFPGTKRDQRYQWLKRARDLVLPQASAELKALLWQGIWTKRKAV